jgi:tyrosinase
MNGAFRPSFESGAHARPHLYLGGAMNSFASPDDPIFWLHHCFVDKIYTMWQDCHNYLDPLHITETMFLSTEVDTVMAYTEDVTPRSVAQT